MAFFLRILARGRLGIGPAGHTVEYEQDYGKRVTHWVHLDELGVRQGQNAQLNALTLLRRVFRDQSLVSRRNNNLKLFCM
jgi:hypothetical protein